MLKIDDRVIIVHSLHKHRIGEEAIVVRLDEVDKRHGYMGVMLATGDSDVITLDQGAVVLVADKKETNPKDGIGLTKAALSVLPLPPLYEAALANTEGSFKYGRHNYREAGIRYSVYFDAMIRHLTQWYEGEDKAEDSQVHHLGHIIANCCIVLDDILRDNPIGIDDRPPEAHTNWMADFSRRVAELIERYPDPLPPHTELD